MYIFCISDKNNAERRKNALHEFAKVGIEAEFFDAVMGKQLPKEELAAETYPWCYLTLGEVGCSLSHRGCYDKLLASDEKSAVIFEDDFYFTEEMSIPRLEKLVDFIENQKEPAVLTLYIAYEDFKNVGTAFDDVEIHQGFNLYCTHGYIINRAAAERIRDIQSPIAFEADAFKYFYFLRGVKLYSLSKNLARQQPQEILPSAITNERFTVKNRKKNRPRTFWHVFGRLDFSDKIESLKRRLYRQYMIRIKGTSRQE